MKSMQDSIRNFFCKHINLDDIDNESDIFRLGFVNSLFAIQIVNFLEEKFNIKFENEDLKVSNFNTINNICSFLKTKLG